MQQVLEEQRRQQPLSKYENTLSSLILERLMDSGHFTHLIVISCGHLLFYFVVVNSICFILRFPPFNKTTVYFLDPRTSYTVPKILKKISKLEDPVNCNTEHLGFEGVCSKVWVLQTAYSRYRQHYDTTASLTAMHEYVKTGVCLCVLLVV